MVAKAKKADIPDITMDEVICQVMLTACRDDKLFQKMMTKEPMAEEILDKLVDKYEFIERTNKGLKPPKVKATTKRFHSSSNVNKMIIVYLSAWSRYLNTNVTLVELKVFMTPKS